MHNRAEQFKKLQKNKPAPGDILTSLDRNPVSVCVERKWSDAGQLIFMMYVNALIDGDCTGWYLTSEDTRKALKVLILPESQEVLIHNNRGRLDTLIVSALRVIRHNDRGTALICELVDMFNPLIADERDIDPRGE